jgi:hypothetical protein
MRSYSKSVNLESIGLKVLVRRRFSLVLWKRRGSGFGGFGKEVIMCFLDYLNVLK